MLRIISALFILILSNSCKDDSEINGAVEIYQIRKYDIKSGAYQIEENSVVTFDDPIIYYSDILAYDSSNYFFEISDQAKEKLLTPAFAQPGIPFAVKVSGKIIYTGYFWWSYSSGFCDWVVGDLSSIQVNKILKINLGYPGVTSNMIIPDRRNDPVLLRILKRDDKLK